MAKLLLLLLCFYAASCDQFKRSQDYPGIYDSWSGRFYRVLPYPFSPFDREAMYHQRRIPFNPEYHQFNRYQEPNEFFDFDSIVPAEEPLKTQQDPVSDKADDIVIHWPSKNQNAVQKPRDSDHLSRHEQQMFNDTQGRFFGGFGSFFTLPERFRANSVQLLNNVPIRSTLTFLSTILTSTTVRVPQLCLSTAAGLGVCRRRRGVQEEEPDFVEVEGKVIRPSEVLSLVPTTKTEMHNFVEGQQYSDSVKDVELVESSMGDVELDVPTRTGRIVKDIYDAQVVYTVTSFLTVTQTFSLTAASLVKVSVVTTCVPACLLTIPACPP